MKYTLLITMVLTLNVFAAKAQTSFIKVGETNHTYFFPIWKKALLNSVVAIRDGKNQPLMLIITPAQSQALPTVGTYKVVEGSKRKNKKGSGEIKIELEPNMISVDDGGTVTITEGSNSVFSFKGDGIKVMDTKTKEVKTISFLVEFQIETPTN